METQEKVAAKSTIVLKDKHAVKAYVKARGQGLPQFQAAKIAGFASSSENGLMIKASRFERAHQAEVTAEMDRVRRAALKHITEEKLENTGTRDLAVTAAILTDKIELLEGRATSRTLSVNYALNEKQLAEIIAARGRDSIGPEKTAGVLDSDGEKLQSELASPSDS